MVDISPIVVKIVAMLFASLTLLEQEMRLIHFRISFVAHVSMTWPLEGQFAICA